MKEFRLIVIRHGETDYNRQERYQGTIDIPLNELGRQQAADAIDYLALQGVNRIVASPQRRAWQTAEIIAAGLKLEVEPCALVVERNLGKFEGKTRTEVMAQMPDAAKRQATRQFHHSPQDGESLYEVAQRASATVDWLQREPHHPVVLLVSHGAFLRALNGVVRRVTDEQYFAYQLSNATMDDYVLPSF